MGGASVRFPDRDTVAFVRNLISYLKVYKLIKEGVKIRNEKYTLIESMSVKSAFSILDYILLNPTFLTNTEKDLILKHELIHINQRHWMDLLCSECMLLLQWFNPLAWIYVRLLKENHEFLADKAVLDSGVSPHVYRAVLVNQEFEGTVFSFSSSFNYSKSLNRLSMMKKEKSASWKRLTTLAIVPIFGLFLWASAEPNYIMKDLSIDMQEENSLVMDTVKPDRGKLKKFVVESADESPVVFMDSRDFEDALIIVDGIQGVKLEDVDFDNIEYIDVLKDTQSLEKYGEKGKNGVVIITTPKKKDESRTIKAGVKAAADSVEHEVTVSVVLEKKNPDKKDEQRAVRVGPIHLEKIEPEKKKDTLSLKMERMGRIGALKELAGDIENAFILVDNIKVNAKTSNMNYLNLENIESMTVLKGKAATDEWGEDGKNGVVVIETKKNPGRLKSAFDMKDALIIVDGKIVSSIDDVKMDNVKGITILKDKSATDAYGDEGKNGVVLIEMEKK